MSNKSNNTSATVCKELKKVTDPAVGTRGVIVRNTEHHTGSSRLSVGDSNAVSVDYNNNTNQSYRDGHATAGTRKQGERSPANFEHVQSRKETQDYDNNTNVDYKTGTASAGTRSTPGKSNDSDGAEQARNAWVKTHKPETVRELPFEDSNKGTTTRIAQSNPDGNSKKKVASQWGVKSDKK